MNVNVIVISEKKNLFELYQTIGGEYPNDNIAVVYLYLEKMDQQRILNALKSIQSPRIIVIDLILRDPFPEFGDQVENYYDSVHSSDTKKIFESLRRGPDTSFIFTFFNSCGKEVWGRWICDGSKEHDQITRFASHGDEAGHRKALKSLIDLYHQ